MRDRLQYSPQSFEPNSNIQQMGSEEEVVEVTHHGEREVPQRVEERIVCDRDAGLPYLVAPVDVDYAVEGRRDLKYYQSIYI